MRLYFGNGEILVTECGTETKRHIIMETNQGSGNVGELNQHNASRQSGVIIPEEDLNAADVTLTFANPTSCAVVLNHILTSMVQFKRNGKEFDGDTEMGNLINELWKELEL